MKRKILLSLSIFILITLFLNIPLINASPIYEDFESFTEVDEGAGFIDVINATRVEFQAKRNKETYLYKDYGVDNFTDFVHFIDVNVTASDDSSVGFCWVLSNDIDDIKGLQNNNKSSISVQTRYSSTESPLWQIKLRETYNTLAYTSSSLEIAEDINNYLKIEKIGTTLNLYVWINNSDRLQNDLGADSYLGLTTLTLHNDFSFRYLFVCNVVNTGANIGINMIIQYLDLSPIPILSVTFYNNMGGILRVDNVTIINGTSNTYINASIIELASLPQNSSYTFSYFEWNSNNATTNPYNLTITSDLTIWLYFSSSAIVDNTTPIALIISFGLIISLLVIAKIKR